MQKIVMYVWILAVFSLCFTACSSTDDEEELVGNWVKLSSLDGIPRSDAAAFTIGDYAYVATGYNGTEDERLEDVWRYDPVKDGWKQMAALPGVARSGAVAFTANEKGYICTGYDGVNKLNDLWQYDPITNVWQQKADYPGSGRYDAVAFSIDNKGYVGTGYDGNLLKDFYRYNPDEDTWSDVASIRGNKRRSAISFVIDERAFVCTGTDNGEYLGDMWEYDPDDDMWVEKRDIEQDANEDESYDDDYTLVGIYSVGFTRMGYGYLTLGGPGYPVARTWQYDPNEDVWTEKSEFEGEPRYAAVAFTVNDEAFVATGRSSGEYFDDIYRFDPNAELDEDD